MKILASIFIALAGTLSAQLPSVPDQGATPAIVPKPAGSPPAPTPSPMPAAGTP